jgi:hypothetical protein
MQPLSVTWARMVEAFERNRPTLLELPVRYQYKFDPPA